VSQAHELDHPGGLDGERRMTIIAPPFNLESATQKVRLAEDGWNSRDPGKVSLALRRTAVGGTAPNS